MTNKPDINDFIDCPETVRITFSLAETSPNTISWDADVSQAYEGREVSGEGIGSMPEMELKSAVEVLETFGEPSKLFLRTQSDHLPKAISNWLPNWKENGWKLSNRKPVKHRELWERLDHLIQFHEVAFQQKPNVKKIKKREAYFAAEYERAMRKHVR